MESKLVEYARAVVEDAVDVDADFFQKFRDAMSFRAIMQSQHPYIIGVAISDILKKRVFSRRSTFLFNSDDIVKSISVTGELCGYAFYAFSKVIALERDEFSDVVRDALLAASGSEAFNRDKASLNEEVAAAKRLLILLRVYEEYLAAVLFDYRDELIRRLVDEEGKIIVETFQRCATAKCLPGDSRQTLRQGYTRHSSRRRKRSIPHHTRSVPDCIALGRILICYRD